MMRWMVAPKIQNDITRLRMVIPKTRSDQKNVIYLKYDNLRTIQNAINAMFA